MAEEIKITKDTLLSDLLEIDESVGDVLAGFGLSCVTCPMHEMDTIQDAADVHDLDVDLIVEKLNELLNGKKK